MAAPAPRDEEGGPRRQVKGLVSLRSVTPTSGVGMGQGPRGGGQRDSFT